MTELAANATRPALLVSPIMFALVAPTEISLILQSEVASAVPLAAPPASAQPPAPNANPALI